MFIRKNSLNIIYLIILVPIIIFTVSTYTDYKEKSALTFSNTQTWDPELLELSLHPLKIVHDAREHIVLKTPPTNTSRQTRNELEILKQHVAERTQEKINAIQNEISVKTLWFGEHAYSTLVDPNIYPHTSHLLNYSLTEISILTLHFKEIFNRVRPHILDPELSTAIDVPNHPAYPSGHATQSHFIALILSDIDPSNRETYIEQAQEIAKNREVAGLHYPSDSEAGRDLAEQYFALLKETDWYQTNIEFARSEWSNK